MDWAKIHSELAHRKFRRRKNGHQETRLVTDTSLGGDVHFRYGPHMQWRGQVSYSEWQEWQADAKEIN